MADDSPRPCPSVKIAYIGGGSRYWAKMVLTDLALEPTLTGEVALFDLDLPAALENERFGAALATHPEAKAPFRVRACRDVADALRGADFVFMSILPGRMQLMAHDLDIPAEFGVLQTVGDTTGPGGISRALRTIPIYEDYARLIAEHCPSAWVINYTNPMTLCVAALYAAFPAIKAIGCCHEVFGTQSTLARILHERTGEPRPGRHEVHLDVAGVNHFTFATQATWRGQSLLPLLEAYLAEDYDWSDQTAWVQEQRTTGIYFGGRGMVAWDFFRRFGAIGAAGDRHLVEFVPWYLASRATMERHGVVETPSSYRLSTWRPPGNAPGADAQTDAPELPASLKPSGEEGVAIVVALAGGAPLDTNVNAPNVGQMPQFARGSVVETNAQIRANAVTPLVAGALPEGLRVHVQRAVDVQALTLAAARQCDLPLAYQAIAADPLCAALSPSQLDEMLTRLLAANREALPSGWGLDATVRG